MNKATERWLIPKKGLLVRDPRSRSPLSEKGQLKPWVGPDGRYWRRRVKVGDAYIGNPPNEIKTEIVEKEKRRK